MVALIRSREQLCIEVSRLALFLPRYRVTGKISVTGKGVVKKLITGNHFSIAICANSVTNCTISVTNCAISVTNSNNENINFGILFPLVKCVIN